MKHFWQNERDFKLISIEEFDKLSEDDKALFIMAYAQKYKILQKSAKLYLKQYKGIHVLTIQDLQSQLYESVSSTLRKYHGVFAYVKSPKTNKEKKLFFKSKARRTSVCKYLKKKKFKVCIQEDAINVRTKLSKKQLKAQAEAKGSYAKFPDLKRKEIPFYGTKKEKELEIAKLEKKGKEISTHTGFFETTAHITFYFRKNFIHQVAKLYLHDTRDIRMPKQGFDVFDAEEALKKDGAEFNLNDRIESMSWSKSDKSSQSIADNSEIDMIKKNTITFLEEVQAHYMSDPAPKKPLTDNYVKPFLEFLETSSIKGRTNYVYVKTFALIKIYWNAETNPQLILDSIPSAQLASLGKYIPNKYKHLLTMVEEYAGQKIFEV